MYLQILIYFWFQTDYDMIDYLNELRDGCLEAYTGMVQGLKGDGETPSRKLKFSNVVFKIICIHYEDLS